MSPSIKAPRQATSPRQRTDSGHRRPDREPAILTRMMIASLLLLLVGLALGGVVLLMPYTLRGGGGVELLISLLCLVMAGLLAGKRNPRLALAALLGPLLLLALASGRGALNRQSDRNLEACVGNLQGLRVALESYRQDHGGGLPRQLSECGSIPLCPAAGRDTYSAGYQGQGEAWTLLCKGDAHASNFYDAPRNQADFPRTDSLTREVLPRPASQ